jgi:hypothetical protein
MSTQQRCTYMGAQTFGKSRRQKGDIWQFTYWAVTWLRRLVAGLSPQRPGFDPASVPVGFVVDKVALRQVFLRVLWLSFVNVITPVLHYREKRKKPNIFITGLHSNPPGCGASVTTAAGPLTTQKHISRNSEY